MIEIKNRWTNATIHSLELGTTADVVLDAIRRSIILRDADLRGADLGDADLRGTNLRGTNLEGADLRGANLRGANLEDADLRGTNLRDANLRDADLRDADLRDADLGGANLRGTNLEGANLEGANLRGTNLEGANLEGAEKDRLSILPEGTIIGWKKCRDGVIVKLQIGANVKRSNSTGRKCRSESAEVLEIFGLPEGETKAISKHDNSITYSVGKTTKCDKWNEDRWTECGGGIHFFITRSEAEAYH